MRNTRNYLEFYKVVANLIIPVLENLGLAYVEYQN
jgi:hypothetical protein